MDADGLIELCRRDVEKGRGRASGGPPRPPGADEVVARDAARLLSALRALLLPGRPAGAAPRCPAPVTGGRSGRRA